MSKHNWGGVRKGAGRAPLSENERKKGAKIYITDNIKKDIMLYGNGKNFSEKTVEIIECELKKRKIESGEK
ncbi:hypothetical protein [Senegalia massiliensis]|uniref:Uncharacterized protein n=1 Tax=Senegalia massiliensis TaxID=1720316 RepID=A0A845QWD4_9CLOT|nr:hypothetical protein [Senegalia massiliensis]NBI06099.1 hypothetical protein [Senegalia massiliensis]